jgi:hypothetical protein
MKNLLLIIAISTLLLSCNSNKIALEKADESPAIQTAANSKPKKASFSSQLESAEIESFVLPKTETSSVNEVAPEASTTQTIAKYIPVYIATAEVNSTTIVVKKLTIGQRIKLKAIKAILGSTAKHQTANSDMALIGTLLNKFSFWLGLISIITAIFFTGLGFTLGLLGLIFGIIGTTLPSSNKETGMLGILLSAIGLLLAIIFAAVYRNFLFKD